MPKLSELIKPINDILKKCNKVDSADIISSLPLYAKGKGKKCSPDIQKYWMPIHTTNFEAINSLIVQAPVLHLPAHTGRFYLECDSSAKHIDSVLYFIQNGSEHVIAFYGATMPDTACRYSSSELERCYFEKSTPAFSISVEIFNIHCSDGPQCLKTHLLFSQAYENNPYTDIFGRNFRFFFRFSTYLWQTHVCI